MTNWPWLKSGAVARDSGGAASEAFAEQIEPEPLRHLYHYWRELKGSQDIPNRVQFDPSAIKFCLANVAMAEVERDPFRIRYRLVGTKLAQSYGRDLTNQYVDELYSASIRKDALDAYWDVVTMRHAHYATRSFNLVLRRFGYHRLLLPFSWKSEAVDIVLVGIYQLGEDPMTPAALWRDLANWTG